MVVMSAAGIIDAKALEIEKSQFQVYGAVGFIAQYLVHRHFLEDQQEVYKNQQGRQEEFFFLFIHQQVIIYHPIKKKSSEHILQQEFYFWHLLEFFLNKSWTKPLRGKKKRQPLNHY